MTRISVEELLNESASDTEERRMTATMTLVFVTVSDNCKYSRQWSINSATATKLTLKEFMRFMKSKCARIAHALPKDPRMFYTDEEDDDIFVGSDDEYKEMVKVAINKNKEGFPMVINCVKKNGKKDGRKADLLSRDSKTSPGKVTKFSPKLRSRAAQTPTRPISLTLKYSDDLKELSDELKKTSITLGEEESLVSPGREEIRRQQASVFDWMSSAHAKGQEDSPPAWFQAFMENYKEDLVAEISAKVVQSLGVVIDNKLAGFEKKKIHIDQKKEEKVVVGKTKKGRDTEKVKKEAMRMSMEIKDETESKELKKLRKSLMKKTDKVVKIAMKIEKKQNQEEKRRKPSLSSVGSDSGISIQVKKDKNDKKKKIKRSKDCTPKGATDNEVEVNHTNNTIIYPVLAKPNYPLSPVKTYPVVPVVQNYPIVKSPDKSVSIIDKILAINGLKDDIIKNLEAEVSAKKFAGKEKVEIVKPEGKLANAVYVSESNNVMKVMAGDEVETSLTVTNMGCFEWTEDVSLQQIISSDQLVTEKKSVNLSGIVPGEENDFQFKFKASSGPGVYESVWNFFVENERFGPAVSFKIIVPSDEEDATEMKDFNIGVEMKNLGSSASSLEMVEMIESSKKEDEGFDLLASEVDSLNLDLEKKNYDDDFEVIPIPSCFDLDVPFELIEDTMKSREPEKVAISLNQQTVSAKSEFDTVKRIMEADAVIDPTIIQPTLEKNPMDELVKMGFGNRDQNKRLLDLFNNDTEKVLKVIFEENQVDWAGMRH